MTPDDLVEIEAIKQVKYRYLRALDTKHWDDFADTLTDDIVGESARRVLSDGQRMLKRLIQGRWLRANGVMSFHACRAAGLPTSSERRSLGRSCTTPPGRRGPLMRPR